MTQGPPGFKKDLRVSLSNLGMIIKRILVLLAVIYFFSGFYSIDMNEAGVVTCFGRIVQKDASPGLHYRLPWPIGAVEKVKVKEMKRLEAGFWIEEEMLKKLNAAYGAQGKERIDLEIPYCITADKNIMHLKMVIQYVIKDAASFLYEIRDSVRLLEGIAKNKIIVCVSGAKVDELLTTKKRLLAAEARNLIQDELDKLGAGIQIMSVELKLLEPIPPAQGAFKEVISAQEEKMTLVHEAQSYRNSVVPQAKAEAQNLLNEALAYKYKRLSYAQAEAVRFFKLWREYRFHKEGIASKLYSEALSEIFPVLKKYLVYPGQEKVYLKFFNEFN